MPDRLPEAVEWLRCDAGGCGEMHPRVHECLGEPSFGENRWLGWVYLDLNRPDLAHRELRFCGIKCLDWWIAFQLQRRGPRDDDRPFEIALRKPVKRRLVALDAQSKGDPDR